LNEVFVRLSGSGGDGVTKIFLRAQNQRFAIAWRA
jgi:hypothetical protein